ncbi:M61 family metallopeptidase [Hymenobacter busanensis]|uniref:M61 family metallopeptidase n=1 Tax=Hymenobacter busanensis TaxID=2607656 RepID=A0A7L4ZUW3_9BACT|nr:PDZ domain-containing protein [Hymenobacter busanensis]KAA9332438.1 M61 family metallopeptidase [Hymenobacter busanensis]QHJ07224.1 PDZ domain-containing protein [Hymenobacter busanensis]
MFRSSAARLLLGFAVAAAPLVVRAQAPVQYRIGFPNAIHHEAQVTATFSQVPAGQPLHVRMARSSPGRYALHEFAKNVYDVQATDAGGKPLRVTQPDPYGWDVTPGPDGTVVFRYTLYADRTDGTYAGIDQQHAHLNIPATFAFARGLDQRPVEVRFDVPQGWSVASQLQPSGEVWKAPHLQYFMDSPTSLGPQQVRSWQQDGRTIELAVLHAGSEADLDRFTEQTKNVVQEARAVFGELPQYDFGRYTFVADYLPQATSDGMEHRNSTSVTSPRPLSGPGALDNLGTVSHEFFHSWNVERIRPRDLEPFDFERANMSNSLWFAEGFTQYYGELLLRRSGAYSSDQQYCQEALSGLVNAMVQSPGAQRNSAVYMSQQAPFVDAAKSIDPSNRANTYQSYYFVGGANALALDLLLRKNYKTDLDAFMRQVWLQHGKPQKDFAPEKPYLLTDLQRILGQVSGDTAFAGGFFRQHIYGHELPRFADLLAPAGMVVRQAKPNLPTVGQPGQVAFVNGRWLVVYNALLGTPLYQAGLDRDDELLKLDGKELKDEKSLAAVLKKHKADDVVPVEVRSRGQVRTVSLKLAADPTLEVVPAEQAGQQPTPEQQTFRAAWLGRKAK